MRILILQLARFGDIFITWPTIRALRRKYPGAEIHFLVRSRFKAAAEGCEAIDRVWCLDTANVLEPLLTHQGDMDVSLVRLIEWTELLSEQDFDVVINLSFSPFSSYLTSLLAPNDGATRGYTRHQDGFLAIPDDASAFFYAQVGVGRFNRYHLGEVFAAVADVELSEADWRESEAWDIAMRLQSWREHHRELQGPYLLLHLGASQIEKTYPAFKWHRVILELQRRWQGHIVLIGSESEQSMAEAVLNGGGCERVMNLLGQTEFCDLAALMSGSELVIGGDSAPMHLASFTNTPCLNLSFAYVNFWETGPRSTLSRVLAAETPVDLPSDRVVDEALALLSGTVSNRPVVLRTTASPIGFEWRGQMDQAFEWRLLQAIYSGGEWPSTSDENFVRALWNLREAAQLAATQLPMILDPKKRRNANALIEEADLAIKALGQVVPSLRVLVSWFETERLRMGPADLAGLVERSGEIYGQLLSVLNIYLHPLETRQEASP